jgi:hypothetical protein
MKKVKEWKHHQDEAKETEVTKARREKIINAMSKTNKRFRWDYSMRIGEHTQNDWNQTLMTMINMANKDFGGTALIVSHEAAVIIEDFVFFEHAVDTITDISFYKFGTLNGMIVYTDPYLPAPVILIIKDDFFISDNPDCVVIMIDGLPIYS